VALDSSTASNLEEKRFCESHIMHICARLGQSS
jgi:hypothetical protein